MGRVSVPFAGSFPEAPVLSRFLSECMRVRRDISCVDVYCTDIHDSGIQTALTAAESVDPRVRFHLDVCDLSVKQPPNADFVLGLQPEVTRTDTRAIWEVIIANCVRSAPLVVFATLQ